MRRIAPALLSLALLAAGCANGSNSESLSPAQAVRAAAHTSTQSSVRMDLLTKTNVQGQDVTVSGTGVFDYATSHHRGELTLTIGTVKINERILDGVMYMQLPGDSSFFSLPLSELTGTSLAESSNPGSSAELLAAMGDDTTKVGTETLHGAATTHYKGSISVVKAKELATSAIAKSAIQKMVDGGVVTIPVDVFLDAKGRLRRLIEQITLTIKGTKAASTTQLDLYDFGVAVTVQKPDASQIKDGSDLLKSIKSQFS